ncbi:MAG TPA: phage tail tube protein [Vicinamibacteria bacterium]|nr:phage tail tube protein [Vicinamibacteria bacterium]
MPLPQGRSGQLYVKKEAAYGVEETLAAANAMRHINRGSWSDLPFNKENSPEKNPSPGIFTRFARRAELNYSGLQGIIRPGGALNTLPECDPFLEAAFGSKTNVTLATTVSSSPTTTGATVASAGALAVGDAVLLEVTGQANSPFVRVLTGVAGAALTWSPALPAAQTVGDDVKGGITYKFTSLLSISLTIAHYLSNFEQELVGAGVDSFELALDANAEPTFTVGGPGRQLLDASTTPAIQTQPVGFTTVGGNPPSGLIGQAYIDDTLYLIKSLGVSFTNSLEARNNEYGVSLATELNRNGLREVPVTLEAWAETPATLYNKTKAGSLVEILVQTGRTEGNIVAVYMPSVDVQPPEQDDPDENVNWSFSGAAIESAAGANDELKIALL